MDSINIKIFDEEELTKTLIENYLKEFIVPYTIEKYNDFDEGLISGASNSQIIIFNINKLNLAVLEAVEKLSKDKKNNFLAISYDSGTDIRVKVIRAGAKDFLIKPLLKADFIFSIQQIYKNFIRETVVNKSCRIIPVLSADDNDDKNIVIYNLSKQVEKLSGDKILVIDFPISEYNLSSVFNMTLKLNKNILNNIKKYRQTSLFLLSANPEDINDEILSELKNNYDYIFFNINYELEYAEKEKLIQFSDEVLYIVSETSHKPRMREDLKYLLKDKKIKVIFNKFDSVEKLEDMQSYAEIEINLKIAKNYMAVKNAMLNNKSLNELNPDLDISNNYDTLAREVMNRK